MKKFFLNTLDSSDLKNKVVYYLAILFPLLLCFYNIFRALQIPFYWDEIYTYLHYAKPGVILIKDFDRMDANNHLLNTWMIQACVKIFGEYQFVLRLPNILAFLIYAYFSFRFAFTFKTALFQGACMLILLLNPFANDYFCLARGYGISMAIMLGSLFYAMKFLQHNATFKYAFLSLLFASLALLANFSLLNYLIILILIYVCYFFIAFKKNKMNTKKNLHFSFALVAPIAVLLFSIPIVLHLKKVGALFAGKNNGFWQDTLQSLIQRFLYQPKEMFWPILSIEIGLMIVLLIGLIILIKEFKNGISNDFLKFQYGLFLILFLCVLANLFQHKFMDVLYGYGRTAMYYYPLLALAVIFTLNNLLGYFSNIAKTILVCIVIVFCLNFTLNANTRYAIDWQAEGDSKLMVKDLIEQVQFKKNKSAAITLGMAFPYHDDIIFYKEMYHLPWLNYVQEEFAFNPLNDFFFIPINDTAKLNGIKYKIISNYKASSSVLIKNQQGWFKETQFHEIIDFKNENNKTDDVASPIYKGAKIDSINSYSKGFTIKVVNAYLTHSSILYLNGKFNANIINENAKVVVSIERNGQPYLWKGWSLVDFASRNKADKQIQISTYLSPKMEVGDEIKCYIWNTSRNAIFIENLACSIVLFHKK